MGEIEMKDDWTKLWYFAKFVSATDRRRFEIKFRQNLKNCESEFRPKLSLKATDLKKAQKLFSPKLNILI